MAEKEYKYIYGPVSSWRLGRSLGVDILSQKNKICTFDCIYCQVGRAKPDIYERKIYVPAKKVIEELTSLPKINIDYITLSGTGEPTLAENLGDLIVRIKKIRKEPVAVLTNSSLLNKKPVREELAAADFVMAKLDACSQDLFIKMNNPAGKLNYQAVLDGVKQFRQSYKGIFALQIMFTGENEKMAKQIAQVAKNINPDEVQINTPLRPCGCIALSRKEILEIKNFFSGLKVISVYERRKKRTKPISEADTLKRRGEIC